MNPTHPLDPIKLALSTYLRAFPTLLPFDGTSSFYAPFQCISHEKCLSKLYGEAHFPITPFCGCHGVFTRFFRLAPYRRYRSGNIRSIFTSPMYICIGNVEHFKMYQKTSNWTSLNRDDWGQLRVVISVLSTFFFPKP
jgi:hypothetical protein